MRVPLNWLSRYVDIEGVKATQLQEMLTLRGLEISGVEELDSEISKVVVGKINSIVPHGDSDHLLVCMIDVGSGEEIQIVTGAPNVNVGDVIPVALHGSTLPGDVKIKKGKLRGVESNGMLCSGAELMLKESDYPGAEVNGILILKEDYPLGMDIKTALDLGGVVLEAEPTPNRPDYLSIIGVAREVASALGKELVMPEISVEERSPAAISDHVKVDVLDPDLCPRYMARTVVDIDIKQSPMWMKRLLRAAGQRPINNIVDITNFVMLETGQPMHAFDLSCVDQEHIVVRRANPGETMNTLDGKKREIPEGTLMISDPTRAVGLAGIMGGENSEIKPETKTVLFESAKFNGTNTRRCAKALGLMTEASQRFSKGVDIEMTAIALERACNLVEHICAGSVQKGVIDVCSDAIERRTLLARPDKVNALVALNLSPEEIAKIMNSLYVPTKVVNGKLEIEIPHFRDDIEGEADISEEIARVYGQNNIVPTLMKGDLIRGKLSKKQKWTDKLRTLLIAQGIDECITFSFTGNEAYDKLCLPTGHYLRDGVRILNPFGDDNSLMRTTPLTGMLPVISTNASRKASYLRFFELAKVHFPSKSAEELPVEKEMLCLGFYKTDSLNTAENFFALKGVIERLLEGLDIKGVDYVPGGEVYYHPGRKAMMILNGKLVGQFGELHPDVLDNYDIRNRACAAELDIEELFANSGRDIRYAPIARQPSVERDIAIVVAKDVEAGAISKAVRACAGGYLEDIALFDRYEGASIGEGRKSLAFSLSFRAADRTLTDDEVSESIEKILFELKAQFDAEIRK